MRQKRAAWRDSVLTADVPRLLTLTRKIKAARDAGQRSAWQEKHAALLAESSARRARRAAALPQPQFDDALPINALREQIAAAIERHAVLIVCGETGSGKTTQLPKICLTLGRGVAGLIGHTQPRRLAARATATRIAAELGTPLGEAVGFKVRFSDRSSADSHIKLMTDGILLAETQSDPLLNAYDTLIIDEAHERSANIDFLLGYLKTVLRRRPDLKLIITSATLDAERFAAHFADAAGQPAPVFEVSGRLFPISVLYRPLQAESASDGGGRQRTAGERDLFGAVVDAVEETAALGAGDVLVFLPGEREIREAATALRKLPHKMGLEIVPLFARQSAREQARVFAPATALRRVVLATNIAETSLTVPNIRYVIDSGLARIKRYSLRNKVEQLRVEKISQAAANQRAGRCGRVMDGVCVRLYDEADFNARPAYTDPEVLRASLAGVILRMAALRLGAAESFPFLDAPAPGRIKDGYQRLLELGALEQRGDKHVLTENGHLLARLPLDPGIGRMLLAARQYGCLRELLIIASALSTQDVRERTDERAEQAHAAFRGEGKARQSEFLWHVHLWQAFEQAQRQLSASRQKAWCREHFLSWLRMREWRDVHGQLRILCREQDWRENTVDADYAAIHKALLTGLPTQIGCRQEDSSASAARAGRAYSGARQTTFWPHPGSMLGKKAGKWLLCAELVDTSRLFARCLAQIEPEWIEEVAAHLIQRHVSDPHWSKSLGAVRAFERGVLHGLTIYAQRAVQYRRIDPALCRELLIREGLVAGEISAEAITRLPFLQHNLRLVADIERLEHKSRRPDVLVDDVLIETFYDTHLPAHINDQASLLAWHKKAPAAAREKLFLEREALMRHEAAGITGERFPAHFELFGQRLRLTYRHAPGERDDGVSLDVPLAMLNQIPAARCEWLVAGLLTEKVQALLRAAPQKHRHRLQPLAQSAEDFVAGVTADEMEKPLLPAVRHFIQERCSLALALEAFRAENLAAHFFMNFRLLDEHQRLLAQSRSLADLRQRFGREASARLQQIAQQEAPPEAAASEPNNSSESLAIHTGWTFGALPELIELNIDGGNVVGFPALEDQGEGVVLKAFDTPEQAAQVHRHGLIRLFALRFKEQVRAIERLPALRTLALQFVALGSEAQLREQIVTATLGRACLAEPWPQEAAAFEARAEQARQRIMLIAQEWLRLGAEIVERSLTARKRLAALKGFEAVSADINAQLQALLVKDFLLAHDWERLAHFPRYLDGIIYRLEKLRANPQRDATALHDWQTLAQPFHRAWREACKTPPPDPALVQFRWLLEELRIQLFAQQLRTPMPVSVKRLQKIWQAQQYGSHG